MDAADSWFIGRLRGLPRRQRVEELLLDTSAIADHLDELESKVAELQAKLDAVEEPAGGHVLFVPTADGYAIVEADEPPPPQHQLVLLAGGVYRVARVGRSPFPADKRPCLFLAAD
jgi:hypothetical protein